MFSSRAWKSRDLYCTIYDLMFVVVAYGGTFDGINGITMSVIAGDKSKGRLLDDCVSLSPLLSVSRD